MSASSSIELYVDGKLDASIARSTAATNYVGITQISVGVGGRTDVNEDFVGQIFDARIYGRLAGASEIKRIASEARRPQISYTAPSPVLGQLAAKFPSTSTTSSALQSALFAGGMVSTPDGKVWGDGAWTAELWARITKPRNGIGNNYMAVMMARGEVSSYLTGMVIYVTPTNIWEGFCGQLGSWAVANGGSVRFDAWSHVVLTSGGGALKMYIDGVLKGSIATSCDPMTFQHSNKGMCFGSPCTNTGIPGPVATYYPVLEMAEIALYDRALPPEEIASHFNAATPACVSMAYAWDFALAPSDEQLLGFSAKRDYSSACGMMVFDGSWSPVSYTTQGRLPGHDTLHVRARVWAIDAGAADDKIVVRVDGVPVLYTRHGPNEATGTTSERNRCNLADHDREFVVDVSVAHVMNMATISFYGTQPHAGSTSGSKMGISLLEIGVSNASDCGHSAPSEVPCPTTVVLHDFEGLSLRCAELETRVVGEPRGCWGNRPLPPLPPSLPLSMATPPSSPAAARMYAL